ncbi:MAG: fibronectin type III domain-containing protein, partial [Myxococcota bacterium]
MERKKFLVAAVTLAAFALSTAACGSSTQGGGDVAIPDGGIDAGGDGGRPVSEVVWPVQPADWNPDAKKVPVSIHLTYQRDPATAMTTQWQTQAISKNALKPKLWAVKATEARGEGSSLEIPFALQYAWDGVGVPYTDPVGSKYVEWVTEAMELEPGTKYYYRVGTWESFDFATKTFTNPNLSPIYSFTTGVAAGDPASFTVVLAGDSRSGNEQIKANMERLRKM